ncbi:putative protein tag-76, partial [Trichinella spiralis]|uniref:putative protein tag-76 n=1 Tax=Trichinella spiralis TaxID=6334 RepID=UPI0001EFDCF1
MSQQRWWLNCKNIFDQIHEPHVISPTVEQFLITELFLGQDTNLAADELSQLGLKELVKRPGYGTVGKPIKLACNYFPLIKLQKGDIVVNRYHIDIQHPRLKLNWFDSRKVFPSTTVRENTPSELSILMKFTGPALTWTSETQKPGSLDEREKASNSNFLATY